MKRISTLFILLVGMTSFTVLGSTTHQEQKQTTTFKTDWTFEVEAVNVVSMDMELNYSEAFTVNQNFAIQTIEKKFPSLILLSPVEDVGWQGSKTATTVTIYKQLLQSNPGYSRSVSRNCRSNC